MFSNRSATSIKRSNANGCTVPAIVTGENSSTLPFRSMVARELNAVERLVTEPARPSTSVEKFGWVLRSEKFIRPASTRIAWVRMGMLESAGGGATTAVVSGALRAALFAAPARCFSACRRLRQSARDSAASAAACARRDAAWSAAPRGSSTAEMFRIGSRLMMTRA